MSKLKEKVVAFYQVYLSAKAISRTPVIDWGEALALVAELPMRERTHEETIYDPHLDPGALPVLGVHEVLNPAFMSRIGDEAITDVMDDLEATDSGRFANSTALAFLPIGNVVAVVTGDNRSPKPPKVIIDFLRRHLPQDPGVHWVARPVMDTNKIARLRDESEGVVAFESRIRTTRDLFKPEDSDGVAKFVDEIAQRIGGDVIVDVSVRLAPHARNRSAKQRFRDVVVADLPRVAHDPDSRTKARAVLGDGVEEVLDLVAHRLVATFDVDAAARESLRFSALIENLKDVSGSMEDTVKQLLEG
ncbi:hypothetical protein JN535_04040 [Cellulosimicrobium cellulans]|uniref:hypothetical protein n=1 Tax=Cellulosimicrobium cellulans TaxID=1710 RepID=UPI0019623A16|nr:hypothetical protein [Cellulosimicrobium cellulans]MBN0039344.1 hypothetical protein [Cellulosimicrobium cellulans]